MALLDIILLAFLGLFAFKGYKDGFVLSIINVVILLVSLFLTVLYVNEVADYLSSYLYLLGDSTIQVVAFALLFIVIYILLSFVANILKVLNSIPLVGSLNKFLGALFGFFKGILILSIIVFLFNSYRPKDLLEEQLKQSQVYEYLADIAPSVYNGLVSLIPIGKSFYEEFNQDVKEEIDGKIQESQSDSTSQQGMI